MIDATKLVKSMTALGYTVDRNPGEKNIIYVEGINVDGTPNGNKPNYFNDVRLVLEFKDNQPVVTGAWQATSEPGNTYTVRPLPGVDGAARIALGQHRAWQVGIHHAGHSGAHEALIQTGGPVTVCRDVNKDYKRDGDRQTTGFYGINQHWGYNFPENNIGPVSAGCLVGRTTNGHKEFMALIKTDPRYIADKKYVFSTTILPSSSGPISKPSIAEHAVVVTAVVGSYHLYGLWVALGIAVLALAYIGYRVFKK